MTPRERGATARERYGMKEPCDNCPFRKEGGIALNRPRVREIVGEMLRDEGSFACHKTTGVLGGGEGAPPTEQQCAGAMLLVLKLDRPTRLMRMAQAFKMFDPADLRGGEHVFDTAAEMEDAHALAQHYGRAFTQLEPASPRRAPRGSPRRRRPA